MTAQTRNLSDNDLCLAQRILVRQNNGIETSDVIQAIRIMQTRPDVSLEFIMQAFGKRDENGNLMPYDHLMA